PRRRHHERGAELSIGVKPLPWNAKAAKAAEKYCLSLRPLRPLRSIVASLDSRVGEPDCQPACVAVAMSDADFDRGMRRVRQFLGPFNREHTIGADFLQSEIVDLPGVVQSKEIHVNQR